ncbi:TetR/AcrR family transcriptional regulator [Paraburkholderia heleia]|uniref:TetR/AcrR family transcriptional regulator n=1 Tax=Paraburkholderia heleia TaxID=634127 RepID=UPI002AB7EC38|nr:TetR/AcrR family transcriptional regulator [Paraburkholderia heleia]
MPAAQATKDEIVDRLFTVFRDRGFDGASLADLSRVTGLGKSSLYHHFPEGKEQMAKAVLERATTVIDSEILGIARGAGSLRTRIRKIVTTLDQMYVGGSTPCVLGQLSSASIGTEARQNLVRALVHWIEAIEILARESGISPVKARHFAEDWVARLQGALILRAAMDEIGPYKRAMNALLDLSKDSTARTQD